MTSRPEQGALEEKSGIPDKKPPGIFVSNGNAKSKWPRLRQHVKMSKDEGDL